MQKIRLLGYLLLLVFGSCFIYSMMTFLVLYLPYYVKTQFRHGEQLKVRGHHIIQDLNKLTALPVIGDIFYEEKITELAILQQWEEVIRQSLHALNASINKNSFSIWYHKAMAECIELKLKQCEDSINAAQYLAKEYESYYVVDIKKFLKLRKQGFLLKQESTKKVNQILNWNNTRISIQEQDEEINYQDEQSQGTLLINI